MYICGVVSIKYKLIFPTLYNRVLCPSRYSTLYLHTVIYSYTLQFYPTTWGERGGASIKYRSRSCVRNDLSAT